MNHVMIDLETLGQYGPAIITSLNAVQFDINTGETGKEFSMPISVSNSLKLGLKIDADTMLWWMQQNEEARKKFVEDNQRGTTLADALEKFNGWMKSLPHATLRQILNKSDIYVWGRGPRFDMGILATHYHAFGWPIPWDFRNELCVRTYEFINPIIKKETQREGIEHDGIADAKHQIKYVVKINNLINGF